MKEWQKKVIQKNLEYLIENTVCDSPLFSKLLSKDIINRSNFDSLKATLDFKGKSAAASELYEIVPTTATESAYDILIDALGNSGAAKRLKDKRETRANNVEDLGPSQTAVVTDSDDAQPPKKCKLDLETLPSSALEVRPLDYLKLEKWQEDQLRNNLGYLIARTVNPPELIRQLLVNQILSLEESKLFAPKDNIKKGIDPEAFESFLLYTILLNKATPFDKLAQVLKYTDETVLKRVLEEASIFKRPSPGPRCGTGDYLQLRTNYDFLAEEGLLDFVYDTKELPVAVKKPEVEMTVKDQYKLPIERKGYLLLINIIQFDNPKITKDGDPYRVGAEIDGRYMTELWTGLGYQVYTDDTFKGKDTVKFTRQNIKELITRFKAKCEEDLRKGEGPASIIVYIGSHGQWETICTSDPQPDPKEPYHFVTLNLYRDIVGEFDHETCPALANKPKIFIVQTCQEFKRRGEDVIQQIPYKDALIWKAQAPGFKAPRDYYKGSHFVYCLTYILMNFSREKSFQEMIHMVRLMTGKIRSAGPHGQIPVTTDIGLEELYFPLEPEKT